MRIIVVQEFRIDEKRLPLGLAGRTPFPFAVRDQIPPPFFVFASGRFLDLPAPLAGRIGRR